MPDLSGLYLGPRQQTLTLYNLFTLQLLKRGLKPGALKFYGYTGFNLYNSTLTPARRCRRASATVTVTLSTVTLATFAMPVVNAAVSVAPKVALV